MDQQVVIEFTGLLSKTSLSFDDLRVKMSPHSYPQRINRIILDNRKIMVDMDGEVKEYQTLSMPVKQTIEQRLRLLYHYQSNGK